MKPNFWNGKKVCITGITGFKGAWLALLLKKMGANVSGISLEPDNQSMFLKAQLGNHVDSQIQDIRDFSGLKQKLDSIRPDIVFHLAAQSLVRESYVTPAETFATNVQGTVNLLEAIRLNNYTQTTVVITSDKCYENKEWIWPYREADPLGGHDPYSASKGACEIATSSYTRSFFRGSGRGVASARAGNVIGGGDFAKDRIVPDAMRAFSSKETLLIRSPEAVRPWQHVLEPLSGYIQLAENLHKQPDAFSEAWNFGPSESLTVKVEQLVQELVKSWGSSARFEVTHSPKPHEATLLALDCSKARVKLGWEPVLNFDETVSMTVEWYKTVNEQPQAALSFSEVQLRDYMKKRNAR